MTGSVFSVLGMHVAEKAGDMPRQIVDQTQMVIQRCARSLSCRNSAMRRRLYQFRALRLNLCRQ